MAVPSPRWQPCAVVVIVGSLACGLVGCGGGAGVSPPSISPSEVASKAIKQYDKNGDGELDAAELEDCPALKRALKMIDKNKDGKVSADELTARLTKMNESNVATIGYGCTVTLDKEPLEGATVRLLPEKFMGDAIKPAEGVSDKAGNVPLKMEGATQAGVQWGYYRIEVSKKDASGKELIPARYNTNSTLGCEVAPDSRVSAAVLKLSS